MSNFAQFWISQSILQRADAVIEKSIATRQRQLWSKQAGVG
jgi:hypothetical protein